jgi:hypothetical protein
VAPGGNQERALVRIRQDDFRREGQGFAYLARDDQHAQHRQVDAQLAALIGQ